MPLPPIPLPPFPNVPPGPGVPPLLRRPTFPTPNVLGPNGPNAESPVLRSDSPAITHEAAHTRGPQWGLYDGSTAVVVADSVIEVERRAEQAIADYPIEGGGFQSYNKVARPYEMRLVFTRGGSDADRTAFLDSLEVALKSLTLYTVVTPEKSYPNANVTHIDYRRSQSSGATLITADVWVNEVRTAPNPSFTNTHQPTAQGTQQGGTVQTRLPTPAEADAGRVAALRAPVDDPLLAQAPSPALGGPAPMVTIPTQAAANQTFNAILSGQAAQLKVYQRATGLFVDLYVNDALIIGGVAALNAAMIVRTPYLGFLGDLAFVDTQGSEDPTFGGLGTRFALMHFAPAA